MTYLRKEYRAERDTNNNVVTDNDSEAVVELLQEKRHLKISMFNCKTIGVNPENGNYECWICNDGYGKHLEIDNTE